MSVSAADIEALRDLRDHLDRVSECSRQSFGLTYDEEILLLNRVIHALESR